MFQVSNMVHKLTVAWLVALLAAGSAMAAEPPKAAPPDPAPVDAFTNGLNKITKRLTPPLGCDRLTIADGLPNSNVTAIAQDARGFLWFGTQDGLARYDGTRMTVYRPNDKDPHSVSSGYITSLALDSTGKLWIGTSEHGVNLYDPETDRFERIGPGKGGLTSEGITAIVRDAKDRIWFAMGDGGLNRYDTATRAITAYLAKPLDVPITAIHADREGNLWLGTASGTVLRWNPDDEKATVSLRPNADSARATSITSILARSSGQVWIGTDSDGLYRLDPATKQVAWFHSDPSDWGTISEDHVSVLLEDRHHTLWIGTGHGLDQMADSGRVVRYQHDPNDPDNPMNLAFAQVESLFQDAGGVMWAGGFTVGVCKFDEFRMRFGHYRINSYAKSFFQDPDGSLWVGTLNGLYRYDWSAGRVTIYHSLGRPVGAVKEPLSLESMWLIALRKDHRGTLWIATGRRGLVGFDPTTDTYRQYLANAEDPSGLPVDTIWDIAEDERGALWLASWGGGLVRFDPRSETFTSFTMNDSSGISSNHLYALYPDPKEKDILWVGTAKGGLDRFDLVKHTARAYRHDDKDPSSLSGDDIVGVYREPSGILWVGTYSSGFDRLDPQTGKAERFTTSNSRLTNDTIYAILPDDTGKLWLSTNGGGLLQFDPQTRQIVAYDSSQGVQDNEFSQGAFLRGKSGQLFFGGARGFNAFFPRDIKRDPYVPPVAVTGFKRFDQDLALGRPVWTLPSITLSYSDSFEVQFAALAFAAPKRIRYAYKLDGFDGKFIETDRPFATYTKLAGGHYTLRIRAANQDGVWNEQGIALKLTVTPPWWRSWPAYIAYVLLLVAAGVAVIWVQKARVMQAEREGRLAVVERDLALTGAVQTGFLPEQNEISTTRFQLVGVYRPADSCGGDWWWHEPLPGGRHLVMVGDVTGHGPGPAMVTAAVATALRVLVGGGLDDVEHALALLNREVLRVAKGKYHMTMAAMEIDETSGHWRLLSAGAPPLLSLGERGEHRVHFCPGAPLGTETGFELGVAEGRLQPGDRLMAYTDGIPEIPLPSGQLLGMRKFAQQFERTRSHSLRDAAAAILGQADHARGNEPQNDDWTFALIEWG
jgi:ligand-binding sensor domain-containing protein/serine phosphatase RsbU (regulator of sigma subunit)